MKKIFLLVSVVFACVACKKEETQTTTTDTTSSETIKDIEGNTYNVVKIGTQTWMKENLKVTKYTNGTDIPVISDKKQWDTTNTPAICDYNNVGLNGSTYGKLYNFYVVETDKVCPTGWHVPTNDEWMVLINYLGGDTIAGNKMKSNENNLWQEFNPNSLNSVQFSALPGGNRWADGTFDGLNN